MSLSNNFILWFNLGRWENAPDMTEELLTGTKSSTQTNYTYIMFYEFSMIYILANCKYGFILVGENQCGS